MTHPISHVDPQIVASFDQTFDLSPWALLAGGCRRFGRLPVTWASGVLSCVVFCNQIIATLMTNDLMTAPYAVYLYAVPVCYLVTKRRWFPIGPCPTQGNVVE